MAPALSTTKRKFHKILDSISDASSTSLASTHKHNASTTTLTSTFESPAKRTKFDRPICAYVAPSKRLTAASTAGACAAATAMRKITPNYKPSDREQFLERLKTFSAVHDWTEKPDEINDVQWAKRGWSCVGPETVRCDRGCGEEWVLTLPKAREEEEDQEVQTLEEEQAKDTWRKNATKAKVEMYVLMISKAHDRGCPWRVRGCDDTIQRLPVLHLTTALEHLRERYCSLTPMASELPTNISTPEDFDIERISKALEPMFRPPINIPPPRSPAIQSTTSSPSQTPAQAASPPPTPTRRPPPPPNQIGSPTPSQNSPTRAPLSPPKLATDHTETPASPTRVPPPPPIQSIPTGIHPFVNKDALTLALFGWQAEEGRKPSDLAVATCTACFRRLGLWIYNPDPTTSVLPTEPLYVISEHRYFCPWSNALAQNGLPNNRMYDKLPAWKTLMIGINASLAHGRRSSEDEPGRVREMQTYENQRYGSVVDPVDAASEVGSVKSVVHLSREEVEAKDKKRHAILKKMSQVFHVLKKKGGDSPGKKDGAGGKRDVH